MRTGTRDAWILAMIFVGLVTGGYFAAAPREREEFRVSTTYNPDPQGVKAFYTLLGERLGYNVARLKKPYNRMPSEVRVLFVVQPRANMYGEQPEAWIRRGQYITDIERDALLDWIMRGGVAVFLSDDLAGVPAVFGSNQRMGRGFVYAFSSKRTITNAGMRDYCNAMKLLAIIDRHASKRDLILFDEYHHGLTESRSLLSYVSRQVKVAAALLLAASIVLCCTRARRFGAVRNLPRSEAARPGYGFVESVARLYQRANATDLAAHVLCKEFRQDLCARFGLPADSPRSTVISRIESATEPAIRERIGRLLSNCELYSAGAGQKPSEPELLHMAREIRDLEKELGLGRIDT